MRHTDKNLEFHSRRKQRVLPDPRRRPGSARLAGPAVQTIGRILAAGELKRCNKDAGWLGHHEPHSVHRRTLDAGRGCTRESQ